MKRRTRIIQISGLRGILTVIFIASCLAAGFIAFPAIVAMKLWNFAAAYFALPEIGFVQGLMLWAIIAITGFILNQKHKYLVAYSPKNELSEDELKKLIERIQYQRTQMLNPMVLKSMKNIEKDNVSTKNSEEEKENV